MFQRVAAYLDNAIGFEFYLATRIVNIQALFCCLSQYNLKLLMSKAQTDCMHADFYGHTISPAGVRPNTVKATALTDMPIPTDLKQLCSLLGGLYLHGKFRANHFCPIITLLNQGDNCSFSRAMETSVWTLLSELAKPSALMLSECITVADGTYSFHVYCNSNIGGFGNAIYQEQRDGSARHILYISRSTFDSKYYWTFLDLEAGSIVWAIKLLRGYLWSAKFCTYSDHQVLEDIAKIGERNARVLDWF